MFGGAIALEITYLLHPASRAIQEPLERFLAWTSSAGLGAIAPSVALEGTSLRVAGFTADIVPACTGVFTLAIFFAAVLAYPCSWARKLQGIGLGLVGVLTLNWVRIMNLMLIGAYWRPAFDFAHLVVWQSAVVFFAVFLWLWWAKRYAH